MSVPSKLKQLSSVRAYGGALRRFEHTSGVLGNLQMKFAVFIPDTASKGAKTPTLYYLSGLTCTDENVSNKGSIAFKWASELGIAVVMPDTSPRGHPEIPGENDSYDFGTGAGFYLNATKEPWSANYKMYDYVVKELPSLMAESFPEWYLPDKISITGHSMGGHGALTIGLKNPTTYTSVSAFCPIVNPLDTNWGQKAFNGYLNDPTKEGADYDACALLQAGKKHPKCLLVDQGTGDDFYSESKQLQPEKFVEACKAAGQEFECNMREGYDHSYWFVSTFMENHFRFHGKHLGA
ncbi:unnamed protein product [Amoebophrya sp. A120]|nr:unnamed protein product [Amoebophrya sp. A120]|eukprot:GSA120T00003447001.1